MKLIVTGGAGFIGSNFIHYMLNKYKDYQIICYDKLTYAGNLDNLKDVEDKFPKRYNFINGDIANEELVNHVFKTEKPDILVNFAAESHVDRASKSTINFVHTNVEGVRVLLEACKTFGIKRYHQISTDEVYGELELDSRDQFNENTPLNPRNIYSATKTASEHLVRCYYYTHKIPISISNCTNNYGPYQYPEKIIPLFITNAIEDKPLPIYGDGLSVRDYIWVLDHCSAIDMILHFAKPDIKTYCFSANNELNAIQIADIILKTLNKPSSLKTFVTDRLAHDRKYSMSNVKAKSELSWRPNKKWEQGIIETIEWYKNNEDWWKKLKGK